MQTLPWIVCAGRPCGCSGSWLAAWCSSARPQKRRAPAQRWALTARPVFSTDERRVYRLLREALPHHIVLSKLPLVRFCQPTDPNEVRYWYDLLGAIHVTFAVCSANGRVLAAIDLDTDRGNSRRVLQIKQSVLGACRVRYLRCPVDNLPSVAELQLLVPQSAARQRAGRSRRRAAPPTPAPGARHAGRHRRDRARRAHRAVAGLVACSRTRSSRPTAASTGSATASSAACSLGCQRCAQPTRRDGASRGGADARSRR